MRVAAVDVGIANMALCVLDVDQTSAACSLPVVKPVMWEIITLGQASSRWDQAMPVLVGKLRQLADSGLLAGLDVLVIEAQMFSRMACIGAAVHAAVLALQPNLRVVKQHPQRKRLALAAAGVVGVGPIRPTRANTYKQNKKDAIKDTVFALERLMGKDSVWWHKFHSHKKRDDLADAFLHALYFACAQPHKPPHSAAPFNPWEACRTVSESHTSAQEELHKAL